MNNYDLQIAIWKLRRQLDMGEISIRQFLKEAAELEKLTVKQ